MPELKPMTIIYPVLPAKDEADRAALRPIGRNRDLYQTAIHGATEIVQAADAMGIWGVGTIEHHFWSEGYEVAPAPGAIQAYWAALTKQIHVGVLGYVMATHNRSGWRRKPPSLTTWHAGAALSAWRGATSHAGPT
jgi:hypothetical protein